MKQWQQWPEKPAESRWTDEQWAAIAAEGSNLLVAAAAGSGKTAVLVERIISRIADESRPLDVDAMLVATFTKAAAAEMKERIRHALEDALERNPDSKHLRRQIALLPRASVTTLHSFCLEVVERYAPLIELDPGFRMANDTEAGLLRMDTLDELFEERYAAEGGDGEMAALADRFGGERSDEPLHRLVLELHEFAGSHPWPEHWLRETAARFRAADAEELLGSLWVKSLRDDAALLLQGALQLLRVALRVAHEQGGPEPYIETLFADIDGLEQASAAFASGSWEAWQAAVAGIRFGRLKACKGDEYDPALIERVKSLRDSAKKAAGKLAEEWLVRTPEQYAEELRELAPEMESLAELAIRFGERYEQAKRAKGLLDFGDLEHYALRILRDASSTPDNSAPSLAALGFRDRFAEIYLDEYQDTNEVQEAIVSLIARRDPGNVFMVGDVKQSIYRFRLAEPGLFLEKYKTYAPYGPEMTDAGSLEGESGLRIDLARNFRSRREILAAANHVFRLIMREPVGEMDYDEQAELKYSDGYPEVEPGGPNPYAVEMILLDRAASRTSEDGEDAPQQPAGPDAGSAPEDEAGAEEGGSEETEDLEAAQLEARCIADEIRKLMGTGGEEDQRPPFAVYDAKAKLHRPVQYRDIVILLRAVSALAPTIIEELKAAGIPAYADLATGYFAATEVDTVLSLLSVIDNPRQDIPLAGVLRSPIGGLSAEDLARIRLARRRSPFWEAATEAARGGEEAAALLGPDVRRALADFLRKLEEWRDFARREPLGDLLWMLYRETGYYDFVGGLPGGGQRQANLRALVDRAVQYERSSRFRGLFRFLRFLGRMRDTGADLGAARALGESENVVRIVSIHRSKGLEFPVVFAAGLGRNFNRRDLNGAFLKHKKLGFGPRVYERDTRVTYPTLPQLAIRRKLAAEMLAEEMRVLYVTLTRPKEKLYLIGTSKDAFKMREQWAETAAMAEDGLPPHAVAAAAKYLDWLGPAAMLADGHADPSNRWIFRVEPSSAYTLRTSEAKEAAPDEDRLWNAVVSGEPVGAGAFRLAERIDRALSWRYPHETASQVAAKTSITALKLRRDGAALPAFPPVPAAETEGVPDEWRERLAEEEEPQPSAAAFRLRRPRFMSAKQLTPAERGTAYHLVMQHLPLGGDASLGRIEEMLGRLVERRILSAEQRAGIEAASVAAFCGSSLYERMRGSARVWREVPFTYGLDAAALHPGALKPEAGETVIIQGVIDCLFEEEDGLVLVDYKTDALKGRNADEAAEKHRFQVERYAEAASGIAGMPVKETYVYFFDGGHVVRVT
ncbi:ATP-dependent helicase [Cohnella sp. CIP 111063]|uniref:UvrD-helicase domain-containing protein n=1 Tax=unclassified Cohnella TaxID=2636738 RepID=UPI000B8C1FD4|nr:MULTISPECIES: UvrD-helicase domain-containing protein [unclassified Cohnella]OXS62501.1 ATP-dependent helicase [Cohnella sp. CIP 111063]PRX74746.1 DNA helicase/exodeoxyribonuclease V subunit A [Cohnella sp. SGD-V74]